MATVRLSFTPSPAHVRTARLVGVAVARRAGVSESMLDEVRLAIGEACSRAVALHSRYGLTDLVELELQDAGGFTVRVTDRAPTDPAPPVRMLGVLPSSENRAGGPTTARADELDSLSEEDVAVGMGLALLKGLVDDLAVRPAAQGNGTEVEMSWPIGTRA